jgi:hypothetical protein
VIPPTDLQSLLIDLARIRAGRIEPAELARRWRGDRFVRPAAVDPRALAQAAWWRSAMLRQPN